MERAFGGGDDFRPRRDLLLDDLMRDLDLRIARDLEFLGDVEAAHAGSVQARQRHQRGQSRRCRAARVDVYQNMFPVHRWFLSRSPRTGMVRRATVFSP